MLRRALLLTLAVLLLSPTEAGPDAPGLPRAKDFRKALEAVMKSYPTDGSHAYYWPKSGGWKGTTCDLVYAGETVAEGDEKGRCYCCGLTFEVFFRAYEKASKGKDWRIGELDAKGVRKLISQWFGADGDRRCMQNAIVANGLGVAITKLDDARPGDFVQLWRASGSGHSVVFLGWQRDDSGAIVGIEYWSTQKSTKGIGVNTERVGEGAVKADELYIARVGR